MRVYQRSGLEYAVRQFGLTRFLPASLRAVTTESSSSGWRQTMSAQRAPAKPAAPSTATLATERTPDLGEFLGGGSERDEGVVACGGHLDFVEVDDFFTLLIGREGGLGDGLSESSGGGQREDG